MEATAESTVGSIIVIEADKVQELASETKTVY